MLMMTVKCCRVGTGLTRDERDQINDRLAPLLQERQPGVRTLTSQHRYNVGVMNWAWRLQRSSPIILRGDSVYCASCC